MSDSSLQDVEIHINAWVKEHGTERGFIANNYRRYNYNNEAGLRQWLQRNRESNHNVEGNKRRVTHGLHGNGRNATSKGSSNPNNVEELALNQIRRARYETIPPTGYREEIEDLDHLVKWIQTYTPYMQGDWNNANTRENAQILFFEVFKKGKSTLLGKPRFTGKSKISVAVYLCILANYYYPQGIIVNGSKGKRRIFNGMHRVLINNPVFRKKYGDIISAKNKLDGVFELHPDLVDDLYERTGYVTDDPAIQISAYSGIIGAHPYIVWLEDILQSEFKSEESNEYMLYEVFDGIISKLADRIGGTLTRKGLDDMYSHMPSRGVLLLIKSAIYLIKGAWPDVGDLIYDDERVVDIKIPKDSKYEIIERPEWTVKSLLIMRTTSLLDRRTYEMFEREMQNNPILSEGATFKAEWFSTIKPFDHSEYTKYAFVDPAYGKTTAADFFALIVCVVWSKRLIVIDGILKKGLGFSDQINQMRHFNSIYNISEIVVEANFHQTWLAQEAQAALYNVIGIKHRIQKEQRIDALSLPFRNGSIHFLDSFPSLGEMQQQFLQYDSRPSTSTKKDDGLDVLATAFQRLKRHIKSETLKVMTWS